MRNIKILLFVLIIAFANNVLAQIQIGGSTDFEIDYANPKEFEIGGLKATGVRFLDPNSLISTTGLKVGDKITIPSETISNAIKKLWNQQILGDVKVVINKIEGNYVFLEFKLKERPRLSKFKFTGVKKSEAEEIRESIRLIRGKVLTESMLSKTKFKVEKYYKKKGFRRAEVNIVQKKDSLLPNAIVLNINVRKNDKVKVENIRFKGISAFSAEKLKRKMKATKTQKWYRIFKASKIIDEDLKSDQKSIIEFYNSKGYRDAKISYDTVYSVELDRVMIDMTIEEGLEYVFGDITWSGNFLYSSDTLSKVLNIKKGEPYNKDLLDKKLNFNPNGLDITSLYMDDGYLFFNVLPVEVRVDSNRIDIEMRMYEGEQATIRSIFIKGNTVTSDHVIRRELQTLPGQKFSRTALIQSQGRLAQLGYFNNETIGINPMPDPATGEVDIEYSVEEKPSNQITLSGGWGGLQGIVGTLGLVYTNFSARKILKFREYSPLPSGDGQRLSIQGQSNTRRYQNLSFSFTEPWLGGRKPNTLQIALNTMILRQLENNFDAGSAQVGALKISGANLYLGRRLSKFGKWFQLTNSIGYNRYVGEGLRPIAITDNLFNYAINLYDASFNVLSFGTALSRNTVDDMNFPRSGSQFNAEVKATLPYSMFRELPDINNHPSAQSYLKEKYKWVEFHKWNLDYAAYHSLLGGGKKERSKLVLQTKANIGIIGSYNKSLGAGPFNRFVLGGTGLTGGMGGGFLLGQDYIGLRGYDEQSRLLNELVSDDITNQPTPIGGLAFTKFTAEMRYLVSANPMATIYGLTFFEAGNNFHNYEDINLFNMRRSFGVGVRLFMPMFGGLIGLDAGFPLDNPANEYNPFDNMPQLHFSMGAPLR